MKFWKIIVFVIGSTGLCSSALSQPDTIQKVISNRINSPLQQRKPYVILISADGFRYDYLRKYNASNLIRLSRQGAAPEYMLSSYPSLTFPNHYSMVTGLYPSHHGLVDNSFFDARHQAVYEMHNAAIVLDSSWYGGTPLWVLAEQQKMLSASFYWVGGDVAIQGIRPTYYYTFNELIPMSRRLQEVKNWLRLPEDKRPHLITFYFPEVDHESHTYGPDSKQTEKAVGLVDETVGKLAAMADSLHLPINFVLVSDHGMAAVDTEHPVQIPSVLLDSSVCRLVGSSTLLHAYVKDTRKIQSLYQELKKENKDMDIYLPQETPPSWHYSKPDDRFNRIGDIVLVPHFPKVFQVGTKKVTPGKHGFDPAITEMHATFLAWGPNIRKTTTLQPFENVNVFPLVAELLGLTYSFPIDGNRNTIKGILK